MSEPKGIDAAGLSGFLASLAHDLRSPLGVVSDAVAELRSALPEAPTDEQRLLGTLADRGLRRLGHIADSVSMLAALGSGHFVLNRAPTDLVELARAATAMAGAIEPRREVELSFEPFQGSCRGLADQARLSYALTEIVINAVRHARRRARVLFELAPGHARIAVEDDGQGLSDEARATLFRRLMVRTSRAGLGVGLSIAHDILSAHGGSITVEASTLPAGRPGTIGARFVVSLPLSEHH